VSDSPPSPPDADRPEDYDGLHAELEKIVAEFLPVAYDLWPRLQDHRSRWEIYGYGLADGYDKLVISDVVDLLGTALKSLAGARERMKQAFLRADDHGHET
jgi:hypothetical protein